MGIRFRIWGLELGLRVWGGGLGFRDLFLHWVLLDSMHVRCDSRVEPNLNRSVKQEVMMNETGNIAGAGCNTTINCWNCFLQTHPKPQIVDSIQRSAF